MRKYNANAITLCMILFKSLGGGKSNKVKVKKKVLNNAKRTTKKILKTF